MNTPVEGFSKLSKTEKIDWIATNCTTDPEKTRRLLEQYWNMETSVQKLHDEFIENTLSNYYLPFAVAPNFLIDGKLRVIPMVIEESSVVAAASKAAKFWLERGGFKTEILGTEKVGQVHFIYKGDTKKLSDFFIAIKSELLKCVSSIPQNMEK